MTIMKRFFIHATVMLGMALTVTALTSCDNDDFDTNQYVGGVNLNSFGPSPVARGGELRFLGSGMDQITKITLPGAGDVSDIEVINSGEIRITVPQTAEPGNLILHHAGGTIETKTILTYLEPISIDEISPLRVKPGQQLDIKGEYLNLINEVCFPFTEGMDSVNVYVDDFLSHDRKGISVIVPQEAISGLIILSDAKEVPNMIKSEIAIEVVLPVPASVETIASAKPGQKVTVKGTDFDLIKSIVSPEGNEIEYTFTPAQDGGEDVVEFNLPDNITDGAVCAVTASGVKVALVNLGMAEPTDLVATPGENLRDGDVVTITGVNLDQVVSISLPNVESPVEPSSVSNGELKFTYNGNAHTGDAVLNLKSGKTVTIYLASAMPAPTGFNPDPASAGGMLTIVGRNMDLASTVKFEGVEEVITVTHVSDTEVSVKIPALASTGSLTITKANGESYVVEKVNINAPECTFIVSMDTEEPTAGEIMAFTISNDDKLTGVQVNGTDVQFISNNGKLFINLPSSCGSGTVIKLISSNGEIEYVYDVIPATHVESVIHEGLFDLKNWDSGGLRLYKESFQGVPAGAKLVFYLSAAEDAQIQLNDAKWGDFAYIDVPAGATTAEYELTADNLNRILTTADGWSETAIVINGKVAIINKIALEYENPSETTIWENSWAPGNWGGNQDLAWGGYDWSTVKAGSVLRLYVTPEVANPAEDWWCVALRHGNGWGMLPAPCPDQWGQPVSGVVELELTQGILDDLITNSGLVITGADYTLTKVTIE